MIKRTEAYKEAVKMSAERALAREGVFNGHHGLRGLAEADEFWGNQEARLYYGPGAADYLHRSVLTAAVSALDSMGKDRERGMAKVQEDVRGAFDDSVLRVGAPEDDALICLLVVARDAAKRSGNDALIAMVKPIDELVASVEAGR